MTRFLTTCKALSLFTCLSLSSAASASVTPYFSPSSLVKETILESIQSAHTSIDVAMYSFSDHAIMDAVKTAASNGIQVRLILNKANRSKEKAESLEKAGVDVRYVTPVMHHKFAIIDGPLENHASADLATLLTGSGNWSTSSSTKYDEDLLVFKHEAEFVSAFQKEFNHLWTYSREFGNAFTYETLDLKDADMPLAVFTSANMKAYYRSGKPSFKSKVSWDEGVAGKTIIKEIDQAEDVIRIATAHFRRADIYQALVNALDRGVRVELLLDQQEFHSRNTPGQPIFYDEMLADKGADVRYKIYSRFWDYRTAKQMHTKYLLVDDMTVVTGSFNWSRNAETKVMENLVRITDEELGQSYFDNFEKMWNYGKGSFDELTQSVSTLSGSGPCAFEPISMTIAQIKQLRKSYAPGACR